MEVVVASTLITAFLSALVGAHNAYLRSSRVDPERAKAVFLAQEGVEELKLSRAESWSANIAAAPALSEEYVDGKFLRQTSMGALDGRGRPVSVSVSWGTGEATTTVSISTYISDIYGN